jgi:hypothetical protein
LLNDTEAGPAWLEHVALEAARLARAGQPPFAPAVLQTIVALGSWLECDGVPGPTVQSHGPQACRLMWGMGVGVLIVDVRPGWFLATYSEKGLDKRKVESRLDGLAWLEPMRQLLARAFPDHADGHHPHRIKQEFWTP